MMPRHGYTRAELQQIAIRAIRAHSVLLDERQPGDVVFAILEPRVRTVLLVTPEDAATRLASVGEPYEATLAELRRDPAEVNNGAPGYFWMAAMLSGIPVYFTVAIVRQRPAADAPADARGLN